MLLGRHRGRCNNWAVTRWVLIAVRYGIPAGSVLAGFIVLGLGGPSALDGGLSLIACGAAILMISLFYRATVDDRERDEEQAAREFYSRHGFWPGER